VLLDTLKWRSTALDVTKAAEPRHALGKPAGYNARQVKGWSERYEKAQAPTTIAGRGGAREAGSRTNTPTESGAALIHNDFKYDNVVLTRRTSRASWRCSTGRWRRSAIR
jgi:aminoglycoside phosphotransferase (APT) family kinase protein